MSAPPYMKLYIGDYLGDTHHLSRGEHGAYLLLLMSLWRAGGRLPNDPERLARLAKCTPDEWVEIGPVVLEFFTVRGATITQKRATEEIAKYAAVVKGSKAGGIASGRKRANKNKGVDTNERSSDVEAQSNQPEPEPEPALEMEADASLSPSGDEKPEYPEEFEVCWKAYPHVRGRSSKSKSFGYWRRISAARRALLPSAIARYAREGREPNEECGAPAMDRWLRDQRFLDWLEAPASEAPPAWSGPAEVLEIATRHGAADYLRYFTWRDLPDKALVTGSPTSIVKLKPCEADLQQAGWRLVLEKGRAA